MFCTTTTLYLSRVPNGRKNTRVNHLKLISPPDPDTSPMFIHVHTFNCKLFYCSFFFGIFDEHCRILTDPIQFLSYKLSNAQCLNEWRKMINEFGPKFFNSKNRSQYKECVHTHAHTQIINSCRFLRLTIYSIPKKDILPTIQTLRFK